MIKTIIPFDHLHPGLIILVPILNLQLFISCSEQSVPIAEATCEINKIESYAKLSMQLVETVRDVEPYHKITGCLAAATPETLRSDLDTEEKEKAFWLNIYNAYIQIRLLEEPELFETRTNHFFGFNFFSSPQFIIAGKNLSFDDIEHGIMRRSSYKISMGYLRKPALLENNFIKTFWWDEIEPRIHFALNCGAASCPPITVFDPGRVDEQLDITTRQYLDKHTEYDHAENTVKVTSLISWFRGDFGGVSGAVEMLKSYGIIPEDADPSVEFREYDWTLDLGNYHEL